MIEQLAVSIRLDIRPGRLGAKLVNAERAVVSSPFGLSNCPSDDWILRHPTTERAQILELTANAHAIYDSLLPHGEYGSTAGAF